MQFPRDFLGKSERVREGPGIGWSRVQCKYIPMNLEYTASVMLSYKKLFQKDFRQAAMGTYSCTMHANINKQAGNYFVQCRIQCEPFLFSRLSHFLRETAWD